MIKSKISKNIIRKFNLASETFEQRIISQKAVYILQELGLETNYNFSWYLYGVYSKELADDFFHFNFSNEDFSEKQNITIQNFEGLVGENINDPMFFELVSSIVYLLRSDPLNPFISREDLFNKLINLKPHLNNLEQFNKLYDKIIGLLKEVQNLS